MAGKTPKIMQTEPKYELFSKTLQQNKNAQSTTTQDSVFDYGEQQLTDEILEENGWTENNLEKDLEVLKSLKDDGYDIDDKKSELETRIKVQDEKGNKATEYLKENHEAAYNDVLTNQQTAEVKTQAQAPEKAWWEEKLEEAAQKNANKEKAWWEEKLDEVVQQNPDIQDKSKNNPQRAKDRDMIKKAAVITSSILLPLPTVGVSMLIGSKVADSLDEKYEWTDKAAATWEKGLTHVNLANQLMQGTTDAKDFLTKQNYAAGTIMTEGFSLETVDDINKSYPEIRANKEIGFKYYESNISEEDQKKARQYALDLVSTRVMDNISNVPDYGDCRNYYNEASLLDWVLTHPVNMAARAASDGYDEWTKKTVGKDGMFTLFNIPTYIEEGIKDDKDKQENSPIRVDNYTDVIGNIQTIGDIKDSISHKMDLVEEMNNNIDNPKKFAELYYEVTDGMNFSANKVLRYQEQQLTGQTTGNDRLPLDTVLGRNYIKEDIKKNEMLTNMFFEVNKSVGTMLASEALTPIGAGAINIGVTALEEETQADTSDINWLQLCLTEGVARPIACGGVSESIAESVATKVAGNASGSAQTLVAKGVGTIIADDTYLIADGITNIAGGNYGAATGDAVNMLLHLKSGVKAAFKAPSAIGK